MHGPELTLRPGCFGGLGRSFGKWVDRGQRKVSEDEVYQWADTAQEFLDNRIGLTTHWAFVVTVLDQGSGRRIRPEKVIRLSNRDDQPWRHCCARHGFFSFTVMA